jgi:type I restriction enzyme M protein
MPHKPSWFRDDEVFVSFADTVGINKDGHDLFVVDPQTGRRTDQIDDKVEADVTGLFTGNPTCTARWVPADQLPVAVPTYYDDRYTNALEEMLGDPEFAGFTGRTLGDLTKDGMLEQRAGHGSPSADMRSGDIPYIKVSDIRAGGVNINPSNLVSEVVARRFWKGTHSGLFAFDLITPIRSSKNIGEFAVLMPGQERVVLTKEMLVLRASKEAPVDNFYLLWALSLKVVRNQWRRIVFMQTNREDVGSRYQEIEIPWPPDAETAERVSSSFREYYLGIEALRSKFINGLEQSNRHHVFLGSTIVSGEDPLDSAE